MPLITFLASLPQVVVWTNEGRNESVGCHTKIPKQHKEIKKPKFDKEEDLMKWIESKIDEVESEDEALPTNRSIDNSNAKHDAKDKQDSARDAGDQEGDEQQIYGDVDQNVGDAADADGYFSGEDVENDQGDYNNNLSLGHTHQEKSDNEEEEAERI